ncbi:hypothetical protein L596_010288 [Steinernema carpocapsae]|uniref:Transmembrane protein 18 n=1 Tax=Steinernema carpocapsae TaxID=34508 RepID=A0A4U5PHW0_STECR|nr:hypothetical protein L596_010286 [Steinernema carpocapsae]TKR96239.1 hypothetical protein L596_010288 [Steinernema carpocapsae]
MFLAVLFSLYFVSTVAYDFDVLDQQHVESLYWFQQLDGSEDILLLLLCFVVQLVIIAFGWNVVWIVVAVVRSRKKKLKATETKKKLKNGVKDARLKKTE